MSNIIKPVGARTSFKQPEFKEEVVGGVKFRVLQDNVIVPLMGRGQFGAEPVQPGRDPVVDRLYETGLVNHALLREVVYLREVVRILCEDAGLAEQAEELSERSKPPEQQDPD